MSNLKILDNRTLENDLLTVKAGEDSTPIEISKTKVRIKNLDVTESLNVSGQDNDLIDREGTKTFVKNTGDNFGIGTDSPSTPLHVKSSGTDTPVLRVDMSDGIQGFRIDESSNGDCNFTMRDTAGNADIVLHTGTTTYFNVNGALGIGTTSPADQLTVTGQEGEDGVINLWSDDGDDNADKWRLIAINGGNLELQSYSTGSWVALASFRTDGRLTGGLLKDEDDMASNSAAHIATQQSIKAYVDYTRYIRHIMNVGWNASNANKDYLPLTGYISERDSASSSNEYIAFVAPYDGLLDKVVVRSEAACGSSVVGFHKSDEGTEVPSSTATEEITVDMTTDDTGYTFTFTGTASFDKGDIITISFDPTNTPYDTVATIVWKFDTST